ncbi:MAG: hypothetical protein KH050_06565 [Clostridiaceae bacterium]|nr:hypothetical protein [Clostridiaceae bacterium]
MEKKRTDALTETQKQNTILIGHTFTGKGNRKSGAKKTKNSQKSAKVSAVFLCSDAAADFSF